METIEIITLQRARDFSRRLNATFEFIKQNFRSLAKSLLYIAGPSVLLTGALIATMADDFFKVITGSIGNPDVITNYIFSVSFWLQAVMMLILFFITSVMTLAVINNYVILYDEKKTNRIDVNDVWDRVRATFWMYAGSMMLFFMILVVVYIVLMFVMMLFTLIAPFLMFIGVLGFYAGLVYFFVASSMTFFIRAYEKKGFFDALSRSFALIRGKWWSTFGFALVIYFIASSIAGLVFIPFYVLFIVQMMHSVDRIDGPQFSSGVQWSMIIMFTIYYVVSIIVNMLPNIAVAFQYFNLVELKESRGLISQFETIGQQDANSAEDEQY